jgi:hypothetical protein
MSAASPNNATRMLNGLIGFPSALAPRDRHFPSIVPPPSPIISGQSFRDFIDLLPLEPIAIRQTAAFGARLPIRMPQPWPVEQSETGRSRSSRRLANQIVKPTCPRRSMSGSAGGWSAGRR